MLLGDMICCCTIAVPAMYSLVCLAARRISDGHYDRPGFVPVSVCKLLSAAIGVVG